MPNIIIPSHNLSRVRIIAPSSLNPHEPPGFTQLSPILSGLITPPTQAEYVAGSPNEIGWIKAGATAAITTVDATAPEGAARVLNTTFPPGGGNGASPGFVYAYSSINPQHWSPGTISPKEIYFRYYYKISPNFPGSLSANKMMYGQLGNDFGGPDVVGNKLVYLINPSADYRFSGAVDASPVIFDPSGGTPYNTPMNPTITIQGVISVDGVVRSTIDLKQSWTADPTLWKYQSRGVWHFHELWAKANTPGNQDGSIIVWFNGDEIINYSGRIKWSNNPTQDTWWTMFWDPVYNNMIPMDIVDGYHRLEGLYVSGKV